MILLRQHVCELLPDVANANGIADLVAGVFQHVIDIEAEAVGNRRDARIDDREPELIEQRRRACEAVLPM